MSEPSLRILLVDQNADRAAILEDGLREAGCTDITVVREMHSLLRRIVDIDPDVIFIDLENPNRDVLEQMFQVSRSVRRPIAMFVDRPTPTSIQRGRGVRRRRLCGRRPAQGAREDDPRHGGQPLQHLQPLREELERANQALEERKLDRARQGHPDEGARHQRRRTPTRCCATRR